MAGNFNLDNYVTVSERIAAFRKEFPNSSIVTTVEELHDELVMVRSEVYRDSKDQRPASTGHASERPGDGYVNKTSALENCESSAVGRALAILGYSVDRGVASREEVQAAQEARAELDRRKVIKDELRRATDQWIAIGNLEFDSPADAAREFMRQEFGITFNGSLSAEQWDELDRHLSTVLAD